MKRFILLSFGFMGWAFYEMSGGEEFEPASVRMAALMPVSEAPLEQADPVETVVIASAVPEVVDTDPPLKPLSEEVTRVSLNLTTLEDLEDAQAEPEAEQIEEVIVATIADEFDVPQNAGLLLSSADTPAIIPSLIDPTDGVAATDTSLSDNLGDIRRVTGNRVNVRGGPGTNFGVVTKLGQGDSVEVILDNGDGWVKMRPLNGGPEGWMADFLLEG